MLRIQAGSRAGATVLSNPLKRASWLGVAMAKFKRWPQIATAIGILLAGEAGLRMFSAPPAIDLYRMYRLHGADGFAMLDQMGLSVALMQSCHRLLQLDDDLLWKGRPNLDMDARSLSLAGDSAWRIQTNADGFRDRSASPSVTRVALGDSCTFGWGVDTNWTEALEARTGLAVQNLALPGYSSVQGRRVFEQYKPPVVDVLFLNFGANDGHTVFQGDRSRIEQRHTLIGRLRHALAGLHLVQHARGHLYRTWAKGTVLAWRSGAYGSRVTPEQMALEYGAMADQAERTVLLDICARDEYSQVMREVAERDRRVDLVRYRDLGGETVDGCHPTVAGHRALAEAVDAVLSR